MIDLLNEVSKTKAEAQKKSDYMAELEHKVSKLEIMPLKLEELQRLYDEKLK